MPSPPQQLTENEPIRLLTEYLISTPTETAAADTAKVQQIINAMPLLRNRAMLGSGSSGVRAVLAPALALYPQGDKSDAEWSMWWAAWAEAVGDLPTSALAAAMKAWIKTGRFMPSPGELRALATKVETPALAAYANARKAIELHDANRRGKWDGVTRHLAPPFVRDTKEVRDAAVARVRRLTAEWKAEWAARHPAPPPGPPSHGPLAPGSHLTAAMKAHLAQQGIDNR